MNSHESGRDTGKGFFLPPEGSVIIRGGRVIDPANGVDEVCDLALSGGMVAGRGKALPWCGASKVIDAEGLIVTPGVVDIHSHLFATAGNPNAWAGEYSVFPDGFSFRSGVTTMVDAGSAGWRNFDLFRVSVIDRAKTRVFSFLNIASFGMVSDIIEQHAPTSIRRRRRQRLKSTGMSSWASKAPITGTGVGVGGPGRGGR